MVYGDDDDLGNDIKILAFCIATDVWASASTG
jgi:hypothetical protein